MSLENLGLLLFIKYIRQVDTIKKHMMGSFREFVLALSASFDIMNNVAKTIPYFSQIESLGAVLGKIDGVIKLAVTGLNKHSPQDKETELQERLKKQVLESIIDIIDDEITNLEINKTKNARLKKQALESIKTAFLAHKDSEHAEMTGSFQEQQNQKVS